MSKVLYRKYRSKKLSEIVGQKHITDILERTIAQDRIAHAYLFTGPRGVGKTSIARILAHEINHLPYSDETSHLDIIEIDAASNNGVDDVRDLKERVQLAPSSARKKVYIIDEVHMLSKPAFNALLKTLEEPPEHVVFILATTDLEKLPATIVSRTQRFGFRPIAKPEAIKHLASIAKKESIKVDKDALELIVDHADGSFRDSISLLDQLSHLASKDEIISKELVEQSLGLAPSEIIQSILENAKHGDTKKVIEILNECETKGLQGSLLATQLAHTIHLNIAADSSQSELLDALLEVGKSSSPNLKLLTVLLNWTQKHQSKTVALKVDQPVVIASVEELEQARKTETKIAKKPTPKNETKTTKTTAQTDFDWKKLIDYTKEHYVAIYSVLSKCKHEFDGSKLTIYTGNGFYKKKLDDVKYLPKISLSLSEIGFSDVAIETIPSSLPPKDGKVAAAFAIMGGGEEVSL